MNTFQPFLITGLPRSRTAWLANFLSHGATSFCAHDLLARIEGFDEIPARLGAAETLFAGFADSALPLFAEEVYAAFAKHDFAEPRLIVIQRNPEDVVNSLRHLRIRFTDALRIVERLEEPMRELCEKHEHLSVRWEDLNDLATMRKLWNYAMHDDLEFPIHRWNLLRELQVQILPARFHAQVEDAMPRVMNLLKRCKKTKQE